MTRTERIGFFIASLVAMSVSGCLSRTDWVVAELGSPWPAGWFEMGGSATGGGVSGTAGAYETPALAIDSGDRPVVAWRDNSAASTDIYLRRWNGSTWEELGGSATGGGVSANSDYSEQLTMAIGVDDAPVLTWVDYGDGYVRVTLRRWNGTTWEELGGSATSGIGTSASMPEAPCLAIDGDNRPIVGWDDYRDGGGSLQIYLMRWAGSAWQALGGSDSLAGLSGTSDNSAYCSLSVGGTAAPVAAWTEGLAGGDAIYLRRFDGTAWQELGGSASGAGIGAGYSSRVVVDSRDRPWVVWQLDSGTASSIHVRHWDGAQWRELGGSATGGGISGGDNAGNPAMVLDARDRPLVAYDAGDGLHFKHWDGTAWREVDGAPPGADVISASRGFSMAASSAGFCVAWVDSGDVMVRCHRMP